ncbi:MAG: iron ABC transporter permease [Clostridia bacterium]|nr:iron ABC transporter permease [Clostridia bacterium]
MRKKGFTLTSHLVCLLILLAVLLMCVCLGSVSIPLRDTLAVFRSALTGEATEASTYRSILLSIRLPRVLCVALCGASLSLSGAAMQGLLRNPLADGSTLGVSSGASLGAALALAFGVTVPGLPYAGTTGMAMLFAFGSLMLILSLAYTLDRSLSTHSIILIGVIFSMLATSLISLVVSFSGDKIKSVMFWTMGSLAGSNYTHVLLMAVALLVCGTVLLRLQEELNAFAVGEENALQVGVAVKKVKLTVLIAVSVLIGVCVSVGGTIAFIGLVTPHAARMLVGPNHRRLLPASMYFGAIFLLLADLIARTLLRPIELSVGVVTSLVGAAAFVLIFYHTRKGAK